ncbi:uncharacterized protein NECHADRAFT_96707 [Fusarium vanettenii 77-13-4]|uniref:FMN hydroxy acid dehydrogenase domain-containing protein n=1 Tax=Fusarium vanettenii (strain ATCC MYA-4622 / CBS 123669 / FGSC 9596 / NRRL 45880 / 77-13-4) TaxID=660122 RepID=C7ZPE3_FUSV7|nr:uncharacterized protein NECHADRAFT_96707 [Fusarium vanettenii 77-13-4]EEU34128.1 hypothetical protein NECHADRAFT_96707 [Fusarium vanettenii 77-13-4]
MANRGRTRSSEIFSSQGVQGWGAMDLITVVDNEKPFDRYKIRPRVLKDVSNLDTSTEIFGTKLAHPEGEVATSRAAAETGIPMALSAYANCALEDVMAEEKGNPYIMQFSILENQGRIQGSHDGGGCTDAWSTTQRVSQLVWYPQWHGNPNILPDVDFSHLVDQAADLSYEDSVGWEEAIGWVKSVTKLDIWLKGAIEHGVAGVLISNHGGRQLDGVPATLDALRECAPVAKGKIKIAVDGGIQRSTDIFKAIALCADFCFAGRIPIWGLAYDGAEGVKLAVNLLHDEFKIAMSLAGYKTIKDINKGHLSILQTETGILSKL